MNFHTQTTARIQHRLKRSWLDVNTKLEHFAIISYAVPLERIEHLIPKPFKLWTYTKNNQAYALISAVPFKDKDFSFYRISKYPQFNFFQTNFRTYIIDERDHSHSAWFFGTTLGSLTSMIPKYLWKMPWAYGKYQFNHQFNDGVYNEYNMAFSSKMGKGQVYLKGTKKPPHLLEGFKSMDEQIHILTHPVIGYYHISENILGTYEIWHPKIDLKIAQSKQLYFELFETLGLLTKSEMNAPHSVLISPEIEFDILLPPRQVKIPKD